MVDTAVATEDHVFPPAVIDLSTLSEPEGPYADFIQGVCEAYYRTEANVAEIYWNTGDLLFQYITSQNPGAPGNTIKAAIEKVSADVHSVTDGRIDLSDAILRKMWDIRTTYTFEQIQRCTALRLPVNKMLTMCKKAVSDDLRDQIISEVERGPTVLTSDGIPGRLESLLHPQRGAEDLVDRMRGNDDPPPDKKGPLKTVKSATARVKSASETITTMDEHVALMLGSETVTDDERQAYLTRLEELMNSVNTLVRVWQPIYDSFAEGLHAINVERDAMAQP